MNANIEYKQNKIIMDATQNQKKLIKQILQDIPETKQMLEYEDYCLKPTIGNASLYSGCSR